MAKTKTRFICQECGFETLRWLGRCPECGQWNTLVEELISIAKKGAINSGLKNKPELLVEIKPSDNQRLDVGFSEFNRVLGGGLVPGTVVLLSGDPGIGKSTLLLQAAAYTAQKMPKVLYISGEESAQQIKLRASRVITEETDLWVWTETDLAVIEKEIREKEPSLVIVDSIQTLFTTDLDSAPGSISQIKEGASRLIQIAKTLEIPIILVGHVTKEGNIAGPRVLEHMVDTVLYFEGERHYPYRMLRAMKNRYGSTFELGVFEMKSEGLVEIKNPSLAFLEERPLYTPGSVVTACMEGSRPVLVEIQALVCQTSFGQPRRMTTGTDYNRVNLIMAVLEKRVGLHLSHQDAYVNIVGGIKVQEPAADLAIALALASSLKNKHCDPKLGVIGEVGLTGEVRGIPYLRKRLEELKKLGFSHCIIPHGNTEAIKGIELIETRHVHEAIEIAMQ